MNVSVFRLSCIGLIVFLLLGQIGYSQITPPFRSSEDFSERVNLALRQVGHKMLLLQGDSTSSISPIQHSEYNYELTLQNFNYTALPTILDKALAEYDIITNYHTIVRECGNDTIKLGYSFKDYHSNSVPCQTRNTDYGCHSVMVKFTPEEMAMNESSLLPWPILVSLLLGFLVTLYWKDKIFKKSEEDDDSIKIGKFMYDPENQKLITNSADYELTFRENKLLKLLVDHKNTVVKRETILAEVWEDEGVIVGRSLDVFISRLRKFFNEDPSVQIKNVHSVGYRLLIS